MKKVSISLSEAFDKNDPDFTNKQESFNKLKEAVFGSILDTGISPVFGGDLIKDGLADFIKDKINEIGNPDLKVISKSFWPINLLMKEETKEKYKDCIDFMPVELADHYGTNNLILTTNVDPIKLISSNDTLTKVFISVQLTDMRKSIVDMCDAAVFMGGKTSNYMGHCPGVLEELYHTRGKNPFYLCGGFGGVTRHLIDYCIYNKERPKELTVEYQMENNAGYKEMIEYINEKQEWYSLEYPYIIYELKEYISSSLFDNGLTKEENYELFETQNVSRIGFLITKGLKKCFDC